MGFDLQSRQYVRDPGTRVWAREGYQSIAYNDGDAVEQRIYDSISKSDDVSTLSPQLAAHMTDWPSLYHLTPLRGNLLRPIKHLLRGKILEIGAGCGAITRFLGENGADVLALEGSAMRAKIAASRCRDLDNVTVLADTFHDFVKEPIFDAVTLIGVLEYARKFVHGEDPINTMLAHARSMLRPGGVLIIAIENQLGLKYFAGYPEDHMGVAMYGVEDHYKPDEVVTFGREELKRRVAGAALDHQQWWYPFPDYKLPVSLLSERAVDEVTQLDMAPLLSHAASTDPQRPPLLFFTLENAWKPIFRNQLAGHLSNSFLIVASDAEIKAPAENALAYHYSVKRRPAFAKQVAFIEDANGTIKVKQESLYPDAALPKDLPLAIRLDPQEYEQGTQWKDRLVEILNTPSWKMTDIESWAAVWYAFLLKKTGLAGKTGLTAKHEVPGEYIDLLPRNLIVGKNGDCRLIDQEWTVNFSLELGFMLFRGILLELVTVNIMAVPADGQQVLLADVFTKIANGLGVTISPDDLARYAELENQFQVWATGLTQGSLHQWLLQRRLPVRLPVINELQILVGQRDNVMAQLTELQRKVNGG